MRFLEFFKRTYSKKENSRHCLNCFYSILVGKHETKLGCAKKMTIIKTFPSITANICKDYIEQ